MIHARGLVQTFQTKQGRKKSEVRAVDGVDLDIEEGEVVGFLGPNGAGKTTTLRMLTTLLTPTEGAATVAGYDVVTQSEQVRRSIGYVSQAGGADQGRIVAADTADNLKTEVAGDLVDLEVVDPAHLAEAAQKLGSIVDPRSEVEVQDRHVRGRVPRAGRTIQGLLRDLDRSGIDLDSIEVHRPTLDDVFLALTGRSLRDAEADADAAASDGDASATPVPSDVPEGALR